MPLFKRKDGTLLKKLPLFRKLNPYLMKTRTESTIFIPYHIDVTNALAYIDKMEKKLNKKISIFNILLAAVVRTFALRPKLNRFVSGTKIYQRNEIVLSFIAKKQLTDHAKETNVKMRFSPYETIFSIIDKLEAELQLAKSEDEEYYQDKEVNTFGKLPGFILRFLIWIFRKLDKHNLAPFSMIKNDPLYCSAYLTNMGSVGMPLGPHHHLFEWGTASIFLSFSEHTKRPVINDDGEIVVRDVLDMIVSWDDRIADGLYGNRCAHYIIDYVKHPERLEKPPEISDHILEELNLKPYFEIPQEKKTPLMEVEIEGEEKQSDQEELLETIKT